MMTERAYTFFEMLITLVLIAVLVAVTLPALRYFFDNANDRVLQGELMRAVQFARQAALTRGVPVVLCGSTDKRSCTKEWMPYLLTFMTSDKNANQVSDATRVLTTTKLPLQQGQLFWRGFPKYRQHLLFLPTGMMESDNGTFWYCYCRKNLPAWAMVLSKSGRSRLVYPDGNGDIKMGEETLKC